MNARGQYGHTSRSYGRREAWSPRREVLFGRNNARVAGDFHTIPDREAAWAIVHKAGDDLEQDLKASGIEQDSPTINPDRWMFWTTLAKPALAEWKMFVADQEAGRKNVDANHSWQMQYATAGAGGPSSAWRKAFDAYDHWLARIADLRKTVRALHIPLYSPEPPKPGSLPSTESVVEKIENLPGDIADAARKYGKYALIGAGVLGGGLLLVAMSKAGR